MTLRLRTGEETAEVEARPGLTLADLAASAGLVLNTRCGGHGTCGGCRVRLGPGVYRSDGETWTVCEGETRDALACQAWLTGPDGSIDVPSASLLEHGARIADDFVAPVVAGQPRQRKVCLSVRPGTLEHPAARDEQVARAFRDAERMPGPLRWRPAALRDLAAIPVEETRLTVTAAFSEGAWDLVRCEAGDTSGAHWGLAVDIGTTTVVVLLVDLRHGVMTARASRYNQQIRLADDVASRISRASDPSQVRDLQRLLVEDTLNPLIRQLVEAQGIRTDDITSLVAAGNTVMTHLFLGWSPDGLGRVPFTPVCLTPAPLRAGDLGLAMHPEGTVEAAPSMAGYVGGDITADVHVSRLGGLPGCVLLVDLGTNGEMVLRTADGKLTACATAAGPAFEGAGLQHGCRAAQGAIEKVRIGPDGDLNLEVIGSGRPRGVCGSGIIDFVAEGWRAGWINDRGRFDRDAIERLGRYAHVEIICGSSHACVLVPADESATGQAVVVTEYDLSQVLKAKAATHAGMRALLAEAGLAFADVDTLVLAGGFARHVDLRNAQRLGLLPDIPLDRFDVVGNGSLAGAYQGLVWAGALEAMRELAREVNVVELNLTDTFQDHFIDALALPGLNPEAFPRVMAECRPEAGEP